MDSPLSHSSSSLYGGGSGGGHIVAEMADIDNQPLIQLVGGKRMCCMCSHDILGRLMAMSGIQPGLAATMDALLGFEVGSL